MNLDGIDLLEDSDKVDLWEYQAWAEMKMREALAAEAGRDPSTVAAGKDHRSAQLPQLDRSRQGEEEDTT